MVHLGVFASPLDLAATDQYPHEIVRQLSVEERHAHVHEAREQLVERDALNLVVRTLSVLEDGQEDAAHFKEYGLGA